MLFNTSSSIMQISQNMTDEWDMAPALVYKEYSEDGKEVLVHGVEAAHSASVGIAVNAKTKVANAAYLFAEFISSAEGQAIQAEFGFAIPLQRELANSEVFNDGTKNYQVFIDACEFETPADWWYLRDKKWIDDWAGLLNGDVRNGKITLSEFYLDYKFTKTQELLDEYTAK